MLTSIVVGGEELHRMAQLEAERVKRWLDATGRFRISHDAYALDPRSGEPLTHVRVPQLIEGAFERFDLRGQLLGEDGAAGNELFVECKSYSEAGNQGALYDEYLVVCYSAFAKLWSLYSAPPSVEFMWATTHPFSQTRYARLTTADEIRSACEKPDLAPRLGGHEFNPEIASRLSQRLWLSIINPRVEEMIMGRHFLRLIGGEIAVGAP